MGQLWDNSLPKTTVPNKMATIEFRSGTYRVKVRRKGYKPVSASFDTKAQAEAFARSVEHRMDENKYRSPARGTIAELFHRYADEVSPSKKTAHSEAVRLKRLIGDLGHIKLEEVQRSAIWLRKWRDARLKKVKPASVTRELALMSAVFTHAMREWEVDIPNPVKLVKSPGVSKPREVRMTDEFVAELLQKIEFDPQAPITLKRHYVPWVLMFAIETAMRQSEILSLRWGDVHLEESWCHLHDTKNGDSRDVPLTPRAVEIIRAMPESSEFVFPVKPATFDVLWRKIRPKGYRFHDSRHEATTRLSGVLPNVLELSAVTGHRDLRSLRVYYNPTPQELAAKIASASQPLSAAVRGVSAKPSLSQPAREHAASPVGASAEEADAGPCS